MAKTAAELVADALADSNNAVISPKVTVSDGKSLGTKAASGR